MEKEDEESQRHKAILEENSLETLLGELAKEHESYDEFAKEVLEIAGEVWEESVDAHSESLGDLDDINETWRDDEK